jgi:iron complex transport system permease protein
MRVISLYLFILCLLAVALLLGGWPTDYDVLWQVRFPKVITSFIAGGALGVSGLLMQTLFRNPMAGPFLLGVHGGASLGVALFIFLGTLFSIPFMDYGLPVVSIAGAVASMVLVAGFSTLISQPMLLILGLVVSYLCSSLINILMVMGSSSQVQEFVLWTLGSFERTYGAEFYFFVFGILLSCTLTFIVHKKLDVVYQGEQFAESLGVSVKSLTLIIVFLVAALSGLVIAYCGPIIFVGVMAPHGARFIYKELSHLKLIPGSFLVGGLFTLFAQLISSAVATPIPVNSILGFLGIPFLIIIFKRSSISKGRKL